MNEKPSIDWSHVSPEYRWLAKDADQRAWLYIDEPTLWIDGWSIGLEGRIPLIQAAGFASYRPGSCDWRDSLVARD